MNVYCCLKDAVLRAYQYHTIQNVIATMIAPSVKGPANTIRIVRPHSITFVKNERRRILLYLVAKEIPMGIEIIVSIVMTFADIKYVGDGVEQILIVKNQIVRTWGAADSAPQVNRMILVG